MFTLCLQVLVVSLCIFLLSLAIPTTPYSLCLQVLVVSLCIFLLSLADTYYPYSRGALLTSCVVLYALTAGFAGYTSSVQYKLMNGDNWVSNNIIGKLPVWELPLHPAGSKPSWTKLHAQGQVLSHPAAVG